jgi:hypothetical protein
MAKEKVYTRKVSDTTESSQTVETKVKNHTNLTFGKKTYTFMAIGMGLILLGLALMSGGKMSDPNVWDEGVIYSFRRITLAPIVILLGLVLNVYAIFVKE